MSMGKFRKGQEVDQKIQGKNLRLPSRPNSDKVTRQNSIANIQPDPSIVQEKEGDETDGG